MSRTGANCGWWLLLAAGVVLGLGSPVHADEDAVPVGPQDAAWSQREFWQTPDGKPVNDGWQFVDGEVVLAVPGRGGNIVSPPLSSSFELSWQWKIENGVNSGLKYRVRSFGSGPLSRTLGLEYQIIDSAPADTSLGSTAAIYDLVSPQAEKVLHPRAPGTSRGSLPSGIGSNTGSTASW